MLEVPAPVLVPVPPAPTPPAPDEEGRSVGCCAGVPWAGLALPLGAMDPTVVVVASEVRADVGGMVSGSGSGSVSVAVAVAVVAAIAWPRDDSSAARTVLGLARTLVRLGVVKPARKVVLVVTAPSVALEAGAKGKVRGTPVVLAGLVDTGGRVAFGKVEEEEDELSPVLLDGELVVTAVVSLRLLVGE